MNKKLDLVIVEAIKSIIAESDFDVDYDIKKDNCDPTKLKRVIDGAKKKEIITVNITLTKNLE